jgi:NTP pyrophosphatase (non-canonical NTP hydrolase)
MTQVTHPEMVAQLAKPGEEILKTLDLRNWSVLRGSVFTAIAASDHLDQAKKQVIYNKPMGLASVSVRQMPQVTPEQMHLLHMAIGIFGEAGEMLEAIANHVISGEPLNLENVREEGGDLEFYLEGLRQGLNASREDWLQGNIDKLSVRYEGLQYSDSAAQTRADKAEEPAGEPVTA